MMYSKVALLLASAASLAHALSDTQIAELKAIMSDVATNISEYMELATDGTISLSDLPAGVLSLGLAVASATDDSYTTLYDDVDMDAVETWLTVLPWYSTRLSSEIAAALYTLTADASSAAASSSVVEATTSSAVATSSVATSAAASSVASSSAATSSVASTTATSVAVSSSASSSATVSQQTGNGAGKITGAGAAGILAAAALLL
ncbi:hypothetical protein C6P45_000133 [Maudiozyma exigua]|uniref:Temperature shock-inducible protein 1 n=1 Tax=Maudiozyma exigua TaxID=34358 RepID=A0A9P6WGM0_MAUEX|nr:hypothetical protein C6P45_000133 [Kazachstania exigua]